MPSVALVRPIAATFWELRMAWASGRRVAMTLDAPIGRVEGHVTRVAATDTFVYVGDILVPSGVILAVHLPSRVGDSTIRPGEAWGVRGRRLRPPEGQSELPFHTTTAGETMHTIEISDALWEAWSRSPRAMRDSLWEHAPARVAEVSEPDPPTALRDSPTGAIGTAIVATRTTRCPRCGDDVTTGERAVMMDWQSYAGGRIKSDAFHRSCAEERGWVAP